MANKYPSHCIICDKEIETRHGHVGRCCSDDCAEAYEIEEGLDFYQRFEEE